MKRTTPLTQAAIGIGIIFSICFITLACSTIEDMYVPSKTTTSTQSNASNNTQSTESSQSNLVPGNYALPKALIIGVPEGASASTSLNAVIVGKNVVAYRYKLDTDDYGEPYTVDIPIQLEELTEGTHTLSVIGKNPNDEWQVEATEKTWSIDLTEPIAELQNTPPASTSANEIEMYVQGTGITQYQYQLDDGDISMLIPNSEPLKLTGLSEGEHTLHVYGINSQGLVQTEPSTITWTILPTEDTTVFPTGNLWINADYEYSISTNVTLTIDGLDNSGLGIGWMRFKNGEFGSWSNWEAYTTTTSWTLESIEGEQTVYLELLDKAGNNSADEISDTIFLDSSAPVNGELEINSGDASTDILAVDLTITAEDGDGSGIVSMQFKTDAGAWSEWQNYETALSYDLEPGAFGIRTLFVRFKDQAGLISEAFADSIQYTGEQVYVATWGDDTNSGLNPTTPVKTISQGLTIADGSGTITQVAVAQGIYSDCIQILDGISLYGGYTIDFSNRDPASNKSIIEASVGNVYPILVGPGVSESTVVEGFTFRAPDTASGDTYAFKIDGGNISIRNCDLYNNTSDAITHAYGLHITNSTGITRIFNLHVELTGTGATYNTGIYIGENVTAELDTGYIYVSTQDAIGVDIYKAAGSLMESYYILCPSSTSGIGLRMESSSFKVNACFIAGGSNITDSNSTLNIGMYILKSNPHITNNIIFGSFYSGNSYLNTSRGLYIRDCSPVIANNMIYAGRSTSNASSSTTLTRYSLIIYNGHPIIINNIIRSFYYYEYYNRYINQWGIYEADDNASPALLWNNMFFTNNEYQHYRDANGGGNLDSASEINKAENTTQGFGYTSANNIEANVNDTLVSEYYDYRLKSGSPAINTGYDTSLFEYGEVLVDHELNNRTLPYDIGPYEWY